jgi:hypothetical protein
VIGRICFLPDAVINLIDITGLGGCIDVNFHNTLAKHPKLNGIDRTYGSALAAQGAFFLAPGNLPGMVLKT